MAGVPEIGDQGLTHTSATSGDPEPATSDLVARIRELTVDDPDAVQQVVAEVLAALDRVTGSASHDRLPGGPPAGGGPGT
jgi:hypothetical protein